MYTILYTSEFRAWMDGLKDAQTRARLIRRLEKVESGLLGDVKPVGEGVIEMREFFGPGWRMYYVQHDDVLIVMLVLQLPYIDEFRASLIGQIKAQTEGNGLSFSRSATQSWQIRLTPVGRAVNHSFTLLHSFELATASPALARLASEWFTTR